MALSGIISSPVAFKGLFSYRHSNAPFNVIDTYSLFHNFGSLAVEERGFKPYRRPRVFRMVAFFIREGVSLSVDVDARESAPELKVLVAGFTWQVASDGLECTYPPFFFLFFVLFFF